MPEARSAFPLALARLGRKNGVKHFARVRHMSVTLLNITPDAWFWFIFFHFHILSKLSGSLPRPLCSTFPPPQLKRPSKRPYYTWFLLTLVLLWSTIPVSPIRFPFLAMESFFPHFLKISIGCHHMSPVTDFVLASSSIRSWPLSGKIDWYGSEYMSVAMNTAWVS